jgi:DNA-binding MarR family transcriptional regulator
MSALLTHQEKPPEPGPQANLGYLFRIAYQRFSGGLDAGLRDLGLTAHEYGILSVFETRSELSTSELARITQVTRQTMHTAIVALEEAGVLERRAQNQRVVLIRLTGRGRGILNAATKRVRKVESAALAGLAADERVVVRGWLARVAATGAGNDR